MAKLNILKLRSAKSQGETFKKEHPELVAFGKEIWDNAIQSGTKFMITVQRLDGKVYDTSFELTKFDADFLKGLIK
ncbi:MAG: hypothetical protein ACOX66_04675 [Oscillospiraceae bacterium]